MNRRSFIKNSTLGLGYVSFFAPSFVNAKTLAGGKELLGFKSIDSSIEDTIKVPNGYEAKPLISWAINYFQKLVNLMSVKSSIKRLLTMRILPLEITQMECRIFL